MKSFSCHLMWGVSALTERCNVSLLAVHWVLGPILECFGAKQVELRHGLSVVPPSPGRKGHWLLLPTPTCSTPTVDKQATGSRFSTRSPDQCFHVSKWHECRSLRQLPQQWRQWDQCWEYTGVALEWNGPVLFQRDALMACLLQFNDDQAGVCPLRPVLWSSDNANGSGRTCSVPFAAPWPIMWCIHFSSAFCCDWTTRRLL